MNCWRRFSNTQLKDPWQNAIIRRWYHAALMRGNSHAAFLFSYQERRIKSEAKIKPWNRVDRDSRRDKVWFMGVLCIALAIFVVCKQSINRVGTENHDMSVINFVNAMDSSWLCNGGVL